ncbi:MAG: hypothetical protein JWO47_180 [Candidatus Saccharibacteria bacterium]|nr:hypothetical protein [Candidatus Saccharibacteria bacterium]
MRSALPIVSAILALIAPVIYCRAILRGDAKPHRTTRFVLLLITILTFASLLAQHNHQAIWLASASAIQAVFIFALSIKHGMGGRDKSDIICLVIALAGMILWRITKQPVLALYFAILADFTGMIPALIKTYRKPETEIWSYFGIDVIAGMLTLLASKEWTVKAVLYGLYIMVINICMVSIILYGQRKQKATRA